MRPNKEVATRGGVDTPHSDVRNCSDDNGVAGVLPGVVVVVYGGEMTSGVFWLRVCSQGRRGNAPNGHRRENLFRKKEDLLAVEFRVRVGARGVQWGFERVRLADT